MCICGLWLVWSWGGAGVRGKGGLIVSRLICVYAVSIYMDAKHMRTDLDQVLLVVVDGAVDLCGCMCVGRG